MFEQIQNDISRIESHGSEGLTNIIVGSNFTSPYGESLDEFEDRVFSFLTLAKTITAENSMSYALHSLQSFRKQLHPMADQVSNGNGPEHWHNHFYAAESALHNAIKHTEMSEVARLRSRLAGARKALKKILPLVRQQSKIEKMADQVHDIREQSIDILQKAKVHFEAIEQNQKQVEEAFNHVDSLKNAIEKVRDSIKGSEQDVETRRNRIVEFFERVEEFSQTIEATEGRANEVQDQFEKVRKTYGNWFSEKREQVADLLQLAVGASLFSAFETEREKVGKNAWVWGALTILCTALSIAYFVWLASKVATGSLGDDGIGLGFWIRIASTPLFLFAIGFTASQYAIHRRLEHEYAFKSTLSLALEPYKDLVMRMSPDDKSGEHLKFVVDTIRQIYSPPVFGSHSKSKSLMPGSSTEQAIAKLIEKASERL